MPNPISQAIPPRLTLVTTPNPRSAAEDESQLTYKPSSRSWVRLISSPPGGEFALNRSVRIVGVQRIPPSPTEYHNQPDEWRRTDEDSVYRCVKRSIVKTYHVVKDSPVLHVKLSLTKPGSIGAAKTTGGKSRQYELGTNHVYYLTERRSISYENRTLEVKMHDGVTLVNTCSSRPKLQGSREGSLLNPESLYYVACFYIEVQNWQETKCKYGLLATSFQSLSAAQVKQLEKRSLEPPRVISAERVPAALRDLATKNINDRTAVVDDKFE